MRRSDLCGQWVHLPGPVACGTPPSSRRVPSHHPAMGVLASEASTQCARRWGSDVVWGWSPRRCGW